MDDEVDTCGFLKDQQRKEREEQRKARRKEEKKKEEISLLEFTRQCVEFIVQEHSDTNKTVHQREVLARPSLALKDTLRLDLSKAHLIEKTDIRGVCQQCKKRS